MDKKFHDQSILMTLPEFIFGAEDDDAVETDPAAKPGDPDPADNEDPNAEDLEEGKDKEEEDGRTKALKAERKIRGAAEREARRLKAENEALKRKDMEEVDRLKAELKDAEDRDTTNTTRYQKLVDGYRNNAIREAIVKEAEKLNFIDTSDAVNHFDGVDKVDLFDVDQDEDDPSSVTIDTKLVASALKKLATSKPHYISKGTEDGQPSGSPFGGSRRKVDKDEDAELRRKYPNL